MTARIIECSLLFGGLPVALAVLRWKTHFQLTPWVALIWIVAFVWLLRDRTFDRHDLFRGEALRTGWKRVVIRFLVLAPVLALLFVLLRPAPLFSFARQHTLQWALFCAHAMILPTYTEEILFRVFFFHRYGRLFPSGPARILTNAFCFSLAHLHLFNVWASVLSFIGGLLFAETFERSRSAALSTLEHGLWVLFIFTLGLGPFFHPALRG